MTQEELNYLEQATGLKITRSEQGWLWVWKKYQGNEYKERAIESVADFIDVQLSAVDILLGPEA